MFDGCLFVAEVRQLEPLHPTVSEAVREFWKGREDIEARMVRSLDDASLFATKEEADAYASRVAKARLILFPSGVVGTPSHGFRSLAIQNTIKGGKR